MQPQEDIFSGAHHSCGPNKEQNVFCMSSYLKTAVIGGNNNKGELEDEEFEVLSAYDNIMVKRVKKANAK